MIRTASAAARVGFVGLGNMGGHMATNLLKHGNEVVVLDVVPAAVEKLQAAGASAADSPAAMAADCDAVVTMLPSNPHVSSVYRREDGLFAGAGSSGPLFIDCSTVDPNLSRELADETAALGGGAAFVDAPVSGGVGGAEAGTLTFMVGGDDGAFARATPVLEHMGANIVHCGGPGTGEVAKLCNNLVLAVSMIGVSEAMNLGDKLGMDAKVLAGILNTSTGSCWSTTTYNPFPGVLEGVPASRGYTGGFGSALMQKDLGLVLDAAKSANAPLPLGAAAHSMYQLMTNAGAGGKDFSAVIQLLSGSLDS